MMKLKDICEINPRIQGIADYTLVSFVPMPCVSENGKIDPSDIRQFLDVKKGYTVFQENDVLFAKITPCMENGKGAIARGLMNGIGCGSSEFHVLRANKEMVCPEWIYYLSAWSRFRREAEKHMTGSAGQRRVPKAYLENYDVNVPSLPEQTKQIQVLSQLQQIIDCRKQELQKLDELVKARFVEMFGDFNLADTKPDWIPISVIGKVVGGSTPKTSIAEYWDGEYRWISPAELELDSGVIYDSVRKITKAGVDSCSLQELPVGTVILSSRAPIGKMAIAGNTFYCNQGFKNIICNEMIRPRYLYALLLFNTEYLNSLGRGATFKEISKSIVEGIKIPLPNIEAQKEFEYFCEQVDKSKVVVQKALDEAQLLFDSLMQQYFG